MLVKELWLLIGLAFLGLVSYVVYKDVKKANSNKVKKPQFNPFNPPIDIEYFYE
jgi:tryptophan-rich sensory protein